MYACHFQCLVLSLANDIFKGICYLLNSDDKSFGVIGRRGLKTLSLLPISVITVAFMTFEPSTQPAIVRIELDKFQEELEPYRLPLEKLTLSEQQMQAPDWINEILTSPHLNIRKKFFTNLKKLLKELRVDWDSEIHIFSLIHMIVPRTSESISYLKESYALLLFMLLLRIQYQEEPSLRYKIKRSACLGTRAYLKLLDEKKRAEKVFNWFSRKNVKFFGIIFFDDVCKCLADGNC
ncbi:hypothetical protein AVEN_160525-1 [Araneus ventricosus]|uniref:Uncharacterized protein n=1 Tax=Araneus ventricosus TaxID=182803 RepID=A0A4Y2PEV4_ARAVE|nr:hypothetical protein AVEN_160525-1 [Araneus ventricosus]